MTFKIASMTTTRPLTVIYLRPRDHWTRSVRFM